MAHSATLSSRLLSHNHGRDPEILAKKWELLHQDPFSFFRGTCRLFYEDLDTASLPSSPLIWATGDLHLQNFGTFKGDNRLTYFDLNDFDEAVLAPASLELVRMCASIFLALPRHHPSLFLDSYAQSLAHGKALWLERATSQGPIRDLLLSLKNRKRKIFISKRAPKGRINTDGTRALPLDKPRIKALKAFLDDYSKGDPFFKLLDAARRIAGNGSLGLERYVLLIEGRGGPNGAFLLDLKYEPGSALIEAKVAPHQPHWPSQAHRVATIQHWCQAISPALIDAVEFEGRHFTLKELLPTADRLDFTAMRPRRINECLIDMGRITAWSHLRSAARRGAATPDELIHFASQSSKWHSPLLDVALSAARHITECWNSYSLDSHPPSTRRTSPAPR